MHFMLECLKDKNLGGTHPTNPRPSLVVGDSSSKTNGLPISLDGTRIIILKLRELR